MFPVLTRRSFVSPVLRWGLSALLVVPFQEAHSQVQNQQGSNFQGTTQQTTSQQTTTQQSSRRNRNSQTESSFSSSQNSSTSRGVFSRNDRERNNNNNSRSTTGNSNTRNRSGQQPQQSATGIQRQEGRQQTRTVRGQGAPRSGGRGQGQQPVVIEFKMKANPSTNILYMEGLNAQVPSLNMVAEEGSTFPVRIMFANNRSSRVKEVSLSLKYDSALLQPQVIDDEAIQERLETESRITNDSRKGILRYEARFQEPASDAVLELFRLEFKAVASASHSNLSFLNTDTNPTRLLNEDGTNVLLLRDEDGEVISSERTGLLDASVAISPDSGSRKAMRDEDGTLRGITMAHSISAGTAEGGISLSLVPRSSTTRAGQDLLVDIQYANPKSAELDSVKLRILFDPRALEVLDHDSGNWISKGINILDGPYQDELPFDFHRRNVAYNSRGEIQYEAGFNSRVRIPPSGTIATIRFRALKPVSTTAIAFSIDEEKPERETSISFLGFNLIGTPGRRAVALTDAVVSVRP